MAAETSFFESDICRRRSIINRRSLSIFSRRGAETPIPTVKPIVLRNPSTNMSSKRMKSAKNKVGTRRSGTILRAVPKADAPTPAPLSTLEQEMATSPNEEILTAIGRPSPPSHNQAFFSLPQNYPHASRTYSVKSSKFSPTRSRREKSSPRSTPISEDTIGVWKDGRIQWEGEPSIPLVRQVTDAFADFDSTPVQQSSPTEKKGRRPRIQVIIPNDQRYRPFPSLPFFSHSNSNVKMAAEAASGHDVSPPSGSQPNRRQSTVSPLSTQMPKPIRPFAFTSKPLGMSELDLERPVSMHKPKPSVSTSSDDSQGEEESSNYSKRSSMTSVDGASPVEIKPISLHARSGSSFSITSPVVAGVFDDRKPSDPKVQDVEICFQVPLTQDLPRRSYGPHPALEDDTAFQPTCALRQGRSVSYVLPRRKVSSVKRRGSTRSIRHRHSSTIPRLEVLDQAIARTDFAVKIPSPTLSEAENELEQHLTSITEDNPFKWDDVVSQTERPDDEVHGPPPAIPRKSSKRMSQLVSTFRLSRVPSNHIASQIKRNLSKGKTLSITIPPSKRMTDDFTLSPIPVAPKRLERSITPQCAENVILCILQSHDSLDDLFANAVVNKGFYRVFKRHELSLIKSTLRKVSPPAWEHREICPPEDTEEDPDTAHPRQEYTPSTYLQYYMRDMYIIAALKSLILHQCQSFLRPEIVAALSSNDQFESSRVDDAFWRIWTFCKMFGSGKGREEDIVGQMDWLRGGVLFHQQGCRSTIVTTDALDMNGALASAPDCFAKGNEGGLTAEQLYDMTELWTCLGVLLQGFEGRTIQAREYGVFDSTEVRGGDIDGEEAMLDEWYYYLLTLGLSTIIDLATPCRQKDPSAFVLAAENGWIDWKPPPFGGSRRNFLKEAVSRVYEDKIAASFSSTSQKEMLRQLSKQRIQRHITEIRRRKDSGERLPEIRMSQERPISEWEAVFDKLTRVRPQSRRPRSSKLPSPLPPLRSPAPNTPLPPLPTGARSGHSPQPSRSSQDAPAAQPSQPSQTPYRAVATPLLPTPAPSMYSHRTSTYDHRASTYSIPAFPASMQHPLQRDIFQSDVAENTSEKAIYRIVEMGFTADQARHALRVTDLGDGLRVDRAVELLLRADD